MIIFKKKLNYNNFGTGLISIAKRLATSFHKGEEVGVIVFKRGEELNIRELIDKYDYLKQQWEVDDLLNLVKENEEI